MFVLLWPLLNEFDLDSEPEELDLDTDEEDPHCCLGYDDEAGALLEELLLNQPPLDEELLLLLLPLLNHPPLLPVLNPPPPLLPRLTPNIRAKQRQCRSNILPQTTHVPLLTIQTSYTKHTVAAMSSARALNTCHLNNKKL